MRKIYLPNKTREKTAFIRDTIIHSKYDRRNRRWIDTPEEVEIEVPIAEPTPTIKDRIEEIERQLKRQGLTNNVKLWTTTTNLL